MVVNQITDKYIQQNFRALNAFFGLPAMALMQFTRLEITLTSAVTNMKIPHGLGFAPTDIMQTWITGPALVQFEYDQFDATNIVVSVVAGTPTTTSPTVLRCLVGSWTAGT